MYIKILLLIFISLVAAQKKKEPVFKCELYCNLQCTSSTYDCYVEYGKLTQLPEQCECKMVTWLIAILGVLCFVGIAITVFGCYRYFYTTPTNVNTNADNNTDKPSMERPLIERNSIE